MGVGFFFKDAQNDILLAKADYCSSVDDPCIAMMEAVRRALVEARNRKFSTVEIRMDVKGMVAWLQRKISPVAEVLFIVEDIFREKF